MTNVQFLKYVALLKNLKLWMRSSRVVRASGCQCQCRNIPGFDPSILRHSGIGGAVEEAVLHNVHKKKKSNKIQKIPLKKKKNEGISLTT